MNLGKEWQELIMKCLQKHGKTFTLQHYRVYYNMIHLNKTQYKANYNRNFIKFFTPNYQKNSIMISHDAEPKNHIYNDVLMQDSAYGTSPAYHLFYRLWVSKEWFLHF